MHPNVEAKIIGPDGDILPRGEQGELCVRGYLVMSKYWNDPEKTAEAVDEDGWCYSGDLAILDEEGYVQITGRVKDMLIRGGENIYPIEIENFFLKNELIQDIQVIGVEDDVMGQEVCAWIVLQDQNESDKEKIVDKLREYASGRISHFKVPRYVRFVEGYPLTVTGKVKKNVMRDISDEMLKGEDNDMYIMGAKKASK